MKPGMAVVAVTALAVLSPLAGAVGQAQAGAHRASTAAAGVISTVAGGVGGPAKATTVSVRPCGVASAGPGELYVADGGPDDAGDSVREVSLSADGLTTPAGTGAGGPLGLGGPAASADWQDSGGTCGIAAGSHGTLVIGAIEKNMVVLVPGRTGSYFGQAMTAGHIYDIAGNGTAGFTGDGGAATKAELNTPIGVAVDAAGNVLVADQGNNRVRVVADRAGTFYGRVMTAGHIYTVAGNGSAGRGGDGGPATKAQLTSPTFVAVTSTGNLVINTEGYKRLRVVAETTGTFYGQAMTSGDIYTVGGSSTYYSAWSPTAVDSAGNIVVADVSFTAPTDIVQVVANTTGTCYGQAMTAGDTYTVAGNGTFGYSGDGGPATQAELDNPYGVTVDSSGNLVIADTGNLRTRVVAASTGTFYGQPMTAGDVYTVAGNGDYRLSGGAGPATAAQLDQPQGVAVDGLHNTLVADSVNNRVMVSAAATRTLFGRPVTAGHIYDEAGDGVAGFSGDNGPGYLAELNGPQYVATDTAGDLVITDTGNERIRVVAAKAETLFGKPALTGRIYTIAGDGTQGFSGDGGPAASAELAFPYGATVDSAGNLVIADSGNNRIRVVAASAGTFYGQAMTAGNIYTVAGDGTQGFSGDGGPASSAELYFPYRVTLHGAGNLVIADNGNERVRVVAATTGTFYGQAMTAGHIYTVAGDGNYRFSGDGGPATSAGISPQDVAVDSAGNLLVADTFNDRVRVVAATTGTFYGQAMTAGNIYTVAGDGTQGFSGDGGPATSAELCDPGGIAVDGANLLIADSGYGNSNTSRIREVTG
jgi:hypothetical protein